MWTRLFGVGELEPRKFVDLVVKLGLRKGTLQAPQVDYEDLRIVDGSRVMNLHNLYLMFLRTRRRARIEFIETYVLADYDGAPERWEDVVADLRPVVRAGAYLSAAAMQLRLQDDALAAKNAIARRELVPGLFATLAIDRPTMMAVVQESQLATWGKTFDEALVAAQGNLRRISQDAFVAIAPGLWAAPWHDAYGAARVLVPDVIQRVCSDPLVCMPNRDVLLVAEPTARGFDHMVAALVATSDDAYAISRRIYQIVHHELREYTPPAGSTALPAYRRHVLEQDLGCYTEDKERHEQLDEDAFYASLMAYELEDGSLLTRAVWTKGVDPTFLPPVQAVLFLDIDTPHIAHEVPWETVLATPGMLARTDDPVPRWRTLAFPSPAWLAEHGKRMEKSAAN
jgi:hypothetical protein